MAGTIPQSLRYHKTSITARQRTKLSRETAINEVARAGDVAAGVGGEEGDHGGDVVGGAVLTGGDQAALEVRDFAVFVEFL
jgi:hypothetical protein